MCTSIPTSFLCSDLKQSSIVLEQEWLTKAHARGYQNQLWETPQCCVWILRSPWFVGNRDKNAHDPLRTQHVDITWTEHETQITQREHTRFVYSVVKITRYYQTFLEKSTRCAKVCGLFFLIVLFGRWLSGQTNCDHVVTVKKICILDSIKLENLWEALFCIPTRRYSRTNAI